MFGGGRGRSHSPRGSTHSRRRGHESPRGGFGGRDKRRISPRLPPGRRGKGRDDDDDNDAECCCGCGCCYWFWCIASTVVSVVGFSLLYWFVIRGPQICHPKQSSGAGLGGWDPSNMFQSSSSFTERRGVPSMEPSSTFSSFLEEAVSSSSSGGGPTTTTQKMVVEKLQEVHGSKLAEGGAALDPEVESFLQSEHAAHSHLGDATLAVLQRKATALLAALDEDDDEKAAERIDASTTSAVVSSLSQLSDVQVARGLQGIYGKLVEARENEALDLVVEDKIKTDHGLKRPHSEKMKQLTKVEQSLYSLLQAPLSSRVSRASPADPTFRDKTPEAILRDLRAHSRRLNAEPDGYHRQHGFIANQDLLVDHHLETLVDSITLTRSRPPGAPTARTATDEPLPETDATGALLEHEKRTATDTGHVSSSAKQSRTRALQKAQSRVHKLLAARRSQRFIGDIVGGIGSMFSRGASFLGFQTGEVRASSAANCMKKCADHSGCKYANYFGGVTGGIGINIPLLNGPNCFLYGQCSITSCYRMQPQDFSGMAQSTDVNKMCSQAKLIWAEMSAQKGGKSMGGGAIDLSCNGGIVPR